MCVIIIIIIEMTESALVWRVRHVSEICQS